MSTYPRVRLFLWKALPRLNLELDSESLLSGLTRGLDVPTPREAAIREPPPRRNRSYSPYPPPPRITDESQQTDAYLSIVFQMQGGHKLIGQTE